MAAPTEAPRYLAAESGPTDAPPKSDIRVPASMVGPTLVGRRRLAPMSFMRPLNPGRRSMTTPRRRYMTTSRAARAGRRALSHGSARQASPAQETPRQSTTLARPHRMPQATAKATRLAPMAQS